jgi:peroxiredoxin
MHRPIVPVLALGAVLLAVSAVPAAAVAVGDKAPGFTLEALDGTSHSLADYAGKVVVLEWLNPNCPFSDRHAREHTMTRLAAEHGEVAWVGINSTSREHRDYLPPAEHQKWAGTNGIDYPILYDESGQVGHAYDARTTPHMFIIDEQGNVVYNGAIDDDPPGRREAAARDNYVGGGLDAYAADRAIEPASTKPYGCSVKY